MNILEVPRMQPIESCQQTIANLNISYTISFTTDTVVNNMQMHAWNTLEEKNYTSNIQ